MNPPLSFPWRLRYTGDMNFKHHMRLAGLLLVLAGGCASPPSGGVAVSWRLVQNNEDQIEARQSVVLDDAALARLIEIEPFGLLPQNGTLTAMNVIHSRTKRKLDLEYRIDWLDVEGNVLPCDFVLWNYFVLNPDDTRFINQNLLFAAAGYRLVVRRKP